MKENEVLETAEELFGENFFASIGEKAEALYGQRVEHVAEGTDLTALRRECLMNTFIEEVRPYARQLMKRKRLSWDYVIDVLIQATATVAVAGIAIVGASAITRASKAEDETTLTGEAPTETKSETNSDLFSQGNDFVASTRPGRKAS